MAVSRTERGAPTVRPEPDGTHRRLEDRTVKTPNVNIRRVVHAGAHHARTVAGDQMAEHQVTDALVTDADADALLMDTDAAHMEQAITAALRGVQADPNPRVGCVIVPQDGSAPVTGWHRGAGTPHAEADALARAGDRARGATAYVSLEPCTHTGRTGPCADALIQVGIARVVYAVADPSRHAGGGARRLAEHGVSVQGGLLADRARQVNRSWLHSAQSGRPFVTLKIATTLDGRVAAADGSSRWITGAQARADAHRLRAGCGAVLVGSGTALIDDPALTVRDDAGVLVGVQPLRVVVGHRAPAPGSRLADGSAPTLHLPTHDVDDVLDRLHDRGVHHALVEGGPTLAAAFLRAGVVDEVVVYLAPALLGAGPPAVGDLGISSIDRAHRLTMTEIRPVGPDLRITLRPQAVTSTEGGE